jgi:vacuolar-type H+-ATPase subunit H
MSDLWFDHISILSLVDEPAVEPFTITKRMDDTSEYEDMTRDELIEELKERADDGEQSAEEVRKSIASEFSDSFIGERTETHRKKERFHEAKATEARERVKKHMSEYDVNYDDMSARSVAEAVYPDGVPKEEPETDISTVDIEKSVSNTFVADALAEVDY